MIMFISKSSQITHTVFDYFKSTEIENVKEFIHLKNVISSNGSVKATRNLRSAFKASKLANSNLLAINRNYNINVRLAMINRLCPYSRQCPLFRLQDHNLLKIRKWKHVNNEIGNFKAICGKLVCPKSFHSHQLLCLKASNAASSENHWFFKSSFQCTLS